MGKKRLGEFLVESGLISEEDLTKALSEQRTRRGKLGDVIVGLGLASESEIAQALAIQESGRLFKIAGIGKTTAARLLLELRDKVGRLTTIVAVGAAPSGAVTKNGWSEKLTEALVGLGWSAKQAGDAVDSIAAETEDPAVVNGDVGVLLRRALALLGRSR